jgi:hypothetical protein
MDAFILLLQISIRQPVDFFPLSASFILPPSIFFITHVLKMQKLNEIFTQYL